jgi:hypothetical protein
MDYRETLDERTLSRWKRVLIQRQDFIYSLPLGREVKGRG